jgi:hypothetical protein
MFLCSASTGPQPISSQHHSEAGTKYQRKIELDKTTKQLDVRVVGTKPVLLLTDPNNREHVGDMEGGKSVLSIEKPAPGEWTLSVADTSAFTTEIGISWEISLDFGFSVQKPDSLKKTFKNPIKGMTLFCNFYYLLINSIHLSSLRFPKHILDLFVKSTVCHRNNKL